MPVSDHCHMPKQCYYLPASFQFSVLCFGSGQGKILFPGAFSQSMVLLLAQLPIEIHQPYLPNVRKVHPQTTQHQIRYKTLNYVSVFDFPTVHFNSFRFFVRFILSYLILRFACPIHQWRSLEYYIERKRRFDGLSNGENMLNNSCFSRSFHDNRPIIFVQPLLLCEGKIVVRPLKFMKATKYLRW